MKLIFCLHQAGVDAICEHTQGLHRSLNAQVGHRPNPPIPPPRPWPYLHPPWPACTWPWSRICHQLRPGAPAPDPFGDLADQLGSLAINRTCTGAAPSSVSYAGQGAGVLPLAPLLYQPYAPAEVWIVAAPAMQVRHRSECAGPEIRTILDCQDYHGL